MSEALPNMPPAPAPAQPRDAAVVVLYRRVGSEVELFWFRRGAQLSFAAGFYAFPGGGVEPSDSAIPVKGADGLDSALRAAAVRELFEETGVLRADGAEKLRPEELSLLRKAVLSGSSFARVLKENGLSLSREHLLYAGRWITPPVLPIRFDARFFLLELPGSQQAEVWPGEHTEGGWVRASEALRRWEDGSALLHPPNLHAVRVLAEFTSPAKVATRLSTPPDCNDFIARRLEFQRGIRVFPLRTPTLPPATHTNCYLVGNGELLIIDPGAPDRAECERLLSFVAQLGSEGLVPTAVVATHHHADHVGGVEEITSRLRIPLWCHERTADRLSSRPQRLLGDGEILAVAGDPPMRLAVLHTPGHARGHLCLVEERSRAAIVGDMVAGIGTIVIDPPEGDMGDYLDQLGRLRDFPVGVLYPAHGPTVPDGPAKLTEYLEHRAHREALVLAALRAGATELSEIVQAAYADVPEFMHPIAERSTQAILIKLARDGQIERTNGHYRAHLRDG